MLNLRAYLSLASAIFVYLMPCAYIQAAETVSIAINSIPGLLDESDPEAPYSKLLDRLFNMNTQPVKIEYFPGSRASMIFRDQKVDCMFPASKKVQLDSSLDIESAALNTAGAFFFSRQPFDQEALLTLETPRYRIAYRRGNTFGGTLHRLQRHTLIEVNSDSQSFGLLNSGRVEFVLGYLPDVRGFLTLEDGSSLYYFPDKLFYSQNDSFLCHSNETTIRFIEEVNEHLATLILTGELAAILGDNYFTLQ
ncbi:hypothetical protein [Aliiglaciecola litoralis]|uniref:Solute-binding protein family 3/N-terminal domain-containing protein n=1 Tax=Aliiglaciecola litoralis TaxID=582857 RepID=A0ABP3WXD2_9ALTE